MAKPFVPEPKFFLVDDLFRQGLGYYRKTWFHGVPTGAVAGEKTTNYLESRKAAERIAQSLPDIKLIFMLRNPVDRAFSNWLWSRMNGKETESFEDALDLEEKRERDVSEVNRYARPHAYFSRGLYVRHLEPYFNLFPRKNILCLKAESVFADTRNELERLFSFLGVDPDTELAKGLDRINQSSNESKTEMNQEIRARLNRLYKEPNRLLAELLGDTFTPWEDT